MVGTSKNEVVDNSILAICSHDAWAGVRTGLACVYALGIDPTCSDQVVVHPNPDDISAQSNGHHGDPKFEHRQRRAGQLERGFTAARGEYDIRK